MPDRIIRAQAHKPAEQQVVVQLLEQQPLGADPVERLQQRGQKQLLRKYRGPAFCGVELTEGGIEPIEGQGCLKVRSRRGSRRCNASQGQHSLDVVGQLPQALVVRAVATTPQQVHHRPQEREHRCTASVA